MLLLLCGKTGLVAKMFMELLNGLTNASRFVNANLLIIY